MIYDFIVGFIPRFDVIWGRILGQRPILTLVEVYNKICLEKNHIRAMSISVTLTTYHVTFSARSSASGNDKHSEFLSLSGTLVSFILIGLLNVER